MGQTLKVGFRSLPDSTSISPASTCRGQGLYRYKSATLLEKPSRLPHLLQKTRKMKLPERGTENCVHLLRAFNKEGVEYLLFGSMARSHYRSLASVGDMDVLINPTLAACRTFGDRS